MPDHYTRRYEKDNLFGALTISEGVHKQQGGYQIHLIELDIQAFSPIVRSHLFQVSTKEVSRLHLIFL